MPACELEEVRLGLPGPQAKSLWGEVSGKQCWSEVRRLGEGPLQGSCPGGLEGQRGRGRTLYTVRIDPVQGLWEEGL